MTIFIFSSPMFRLFNLNMFAIWSFQCKCAHDVIKNVGHPNYLIFARTSNWNLFQDAGCSLMVFINTKPLSEVTKVSTVSLKLLLSIAVGYIWRGKNFRCNSIYSLGLIVVKQFGQKHHPHAMKIFPCN